MNEPPEGYDEDNRRAFFEKLQRVWQMAIEAQQRHDLSTAIKHWTSAIAMLEALQQNSKHRGASMPECRNDLAGAYLNRGVARRSSGDPGGAIDDYGQAIEIRESLRRELENRGAWTPEYRNDLAGAYMNRGVARSSSGDLTGAIDAYGQAIEIRESLRRELENRGAWTPEYRNNLAAAYMNRGVARRSSGDLDGAIDDDGKAIEIKESLRRELENRGAWTPKYRNDLAGAYMNRGVTRSGSGDLDGAIDDYGQAIEIKESLRRELENRGAWTPEYRNNLAAAYMNRGVTRSGSGDLDGAIDDYGQAIEVRESLRRELENRGAWTPEYRNDLAAAHMNRGNARSGSSDVAEAIEDYGQAIEIRESLRRELENRGAWTPEYRNDLAGAYMNRGNVYFNAEQTDLAGRDYDRAVDAAPSAWFAWSLLGCRGLEGVPVSWPGGPALVRALDLFFGAKIYADNDDKVVDLCRGLIDHGLAPLATRRLVEWLSRYRPAALTAREDGRRLAKLGRDAVFGETALTKLRGFNGSDGLDDDTARAAVGVDRTTLEASVRLAFGDPMGARDLLDTRLGGETADDDRLLPGQWIGASLYLRAMEACLDPDLDDGNLDWAIGEMLEQLDSRDAKGIERLGRATLHAAARVLWMSDEEEYRERALELWTVATRDEPGTDYLAAYYWRYFAADALDRPEERAAAIDAVVRAEHERRDDPDRLSPLLRQAPATLNLDEVSPAVWVRRVWDAAALHDAAEPIDRFVTDEANVWTHEGLNDLLAYFGAKNRGPAIQLGDETLASGYERHLVYVQADADLTRAWRAKNVSTEDVGKLRKELHDDLYALKLDREQAGTAWSERIGRAVYDLVSSAQPQRKWPRLEWVILLLSLEEKVDTEEAVWLGQYAIAARERQRTQSRSRGGASVVTVAMTAVAGALAGLPYSIGALIGFFLDMLLAGSSDWIRNEAAALFTGRSLFPPYEDFRKSLTRRWQEQGRSAEELERMIKSDALERLLDSKKDRQ